MLEKALLLAQLVGLTPLLSTHQASQKVAPSVGVAPTPAPLVAGSTVEVFRGMLPTAHFTHLKPVISVWSARPSEGEYCNRTVKWEPQGRPSEWATEVGGTLGNAWQLLVHSRPRLA